jgi:osmotically-inducible protein OsmY
LPLAYSLPRCSLLPVVRQHPRKQALASTSTKVKAVIFNEPTLKTMEINVETFKGTVQLSGFVAKPADIAKAGSITRDVQGVRAVRNDIRVK